jgi:hypothetical protein
LVSEIALACLRAAEDRTPTHGYEPTREAAMAAFAKSWRGSDCHHGQVAVLLVVGGFVVAL